MDGELTGSVVCPKCGQPSQNRETCDACGVIIARARERNEQLASSGVTTEEAWRIAGDSSALSVASSGRVPFLGLLVLLSFVAVAASIGVSLFRKKPPETPMELIFAHRGIAQRVRADFEKAPPKDAPDRLAGMRDELLEMRATIDRIPVSRYSAPNFQKKCLDESSLMLIEALDAPPDEITRQLGWKDDLNPIAQAEARLDDAENPTMAMEKEEARQKALEAVRAQQRTTAAMAEAQRRMNAAEEDAGDSSSVGDLGQSAPSQGDPRPQTPEEFQRQVLQIRDEAVRQQQRAVERARKAMDAVESGGSPPQ